MLKRIALVLLTAAVAPTAGGAPKPERKEGLYEFSGKSRLYVHNIGHRLLQGRAEPCLRRLTNGRARQDEQGMWVATSCLEFARGARIAA
jgi:hypothetical protein